MTMWMNDSSADMMSTEPVSETSSVVVDASATASASSAASSSPRRSSTTNTTTTDTKTGIPIALPGRKKSSLSSMNQEKKKKNDETEDDDDDDDDDVETTGSTIAATPHLASRNSSSIGHDSNHFYNDRISSSSRGAEWRRSGCSSSSTASESRRNHAAQQSRQQQQEHLLYKNSSRSFVTPTPHRCGINTSTWTTSAAAATCSTTTTTSNSSSLAWPKESSQALPALSPHLGRGLLCRNTTISMPINEECTALKLTPSGRLVVAGFTDGTLRLYDLTGKFLTSTTMTSTSKTSTLCTATTKKNYHHDGIMTLEKNGSGCGKNEDSDDDGFDSDSSFDPPLDDAPPPVPPQQQAAAAAPAAASATTSSSRTTTGTGAATTTATFTGGFVDSKHFQRYGAVAAQIHAKGVHTSLAMDVDVTEDGLWAFAGVLRGSMELLAVHLGHLEEYHHHVVDQEQQQQGQQDDDGDTKAAAATPRVASHVMGTSTTTMSSCSSGNLLDYVSVYRHSDAKLRGFGACTRLQSKNGNSNGPLQYLLFTGKAIKNIHVWSFQPPQAAQQQPIWTQLYDTQTNGNTIKMLQFRRHFVTGKLQALSKSDGQKLRVWDLNVLEEEEEQAAAPLLSNGSQKDTTTTTTHPQQQQQQQQPQRKLPRPPFQDVAHSESTLGVSGGFCLCGGSELYNQMKIVSLDVDDLQSLYNHTELALPSAPAPAALSSSSFSNGNSSNSGRRRQQRGELKSIISVAGSVLDSGFVLLELSDGTIVQYSQNPQTHLPMLKFPRHDVFYNNNHGIAQDVHCKMTVARIGRGGLAVAAVATYHPHKGCGQISLVCLEDEDNYAAIDRVSRPGFWGFCGQSTVPHSMMSSSSPPLAAAMTIASTITTTTSANCFTTSKKAVQKDAKMEDVDSDSFSVTAVVKCTPLLAHAALNKHVVSSDKFCLTNTTTSTSSSTATLTKQDEKSQTFICNKKVKTIDTLPLVRCLAEHMAAPPNRGSLSEKMAMDKNAESSLRTSDEDCAVKYRIGQNGSKNRVHHDRLSVAASDSLNGGVSKKAIQVSKSSSKSRKGQEILKTGGPPKEIHSPVKKTNRTAGEAKAAVPRDLKSHLQKTTKRLEIAEPSITSPSAFGKRSRKDDASEKTGQKQKSCSPTKAGCSNKRFRKEQSEKKACPNNGIADMLTNAYSVRPNKPTPANKPTASINKSSKGQTQRPALPPLVLDQESLLRHQIVKECQLKREKVEAILQTIPRPSMYSRRSDKDEPSISARSPLEAEHCAARALLSRKIWEATRSLIISVQECPSLNAIKQAHQLMHNVQESYREMAVTMVNRQEMESLAMAPWWGQQASQACDNDVHSSSCSFPFGIFDQALDCMPQSSNTPSAISDPASTHSG